MARFNSSQAEGSDSEDETDSNEQEVVLNDPIASILRADTQLFLCLGQVLRIQVKVVAKEKISIGSLRDTSTTINFQLLHLVPATLDDDDIGKH